ncbi:MAG: delta-60 repeat domain-containing protein, partial [Thiohalomonadales bacterium]
MVKKFWSMTLFLFILILLAGCSGGSGSPDAPGGLPTTPVDNKPPVFIKINEIDIQENSIEVFKVIANDPENDGLSYSLDAAAADSALLNIGESSGNLVFKNAPDFEVPLDEGNDNTYETRINISDGSNTVSFALKIVVVNTGPNTPINTAPTVSKAHFEIAENNLVVGKILASDKEEDGLTWYLNTNGTDERYLSLSGGTLKFDFAPNFEKPNDENSDNVYEMSVSLYDRSDLRVNINFDITVTVIDGNDLPFITSSTKIVAEENNIFVQQLVVDDEDSSTFTYSITGGPDAALFEFTQSGVLNFVDPVMFNDPNHTNGYNVSVEVSDGFDTQTATLEIYVVEKIAQFDTTFGDIDPNNTDQRLGYIYQDSAFSTTRSRDTATDVAVLSNKKLIVVGDISGTSTMSSHGMAVWRYTDQGVLDTDLNTGFGPVDPDDSSRRVGYVYHNTNAGGDTSNEAYGVAITSNDKIVVVGLSRSSTSTDSVVWQFTTDGQLDTTFGAIDSNNVGQRLGYTVSALPGRDRANSVVIGTDGSIFVAGTSHVNASDDMALWKYTPLGDLDASFGRIDPTDNLKRLGYVTHNNAGGSSGRSSKDDSGTDLALTQTGNIIVVGCSDTDANTFTWCQLVVWSFTPDGKLNTNPNTGFGHLINPNSDRWGYFVHLRS